MANRVRTSLIDPILYQSSYVNKATPIKFNFWAKFSFLNFFFNIMLPISVIVFVLFVLKKRYISKLHNKKKFRFPINCSN